MLVFSLLSVAGVLMLVERLGAARPLNLRIRGDIERESRWLGQYGQGLCTIVIAALIWRLDPRRTPLDWSVAWYPLVGAAAIASTCFLLKRLLGRARPGRPNAGRFLGPVWRHDSHRESFPSSHAASAMTLSYSLVHLYPDAALVFWSLAIACALLRYLMDAHWPSDVLAGMALGYTMGWIVWWGAGGVAGAL
jgi:membrane-associated phospholipid phosphatase